MRSIKSHKKRLLKKYKWPSKIFHIFTATGPYEHRYAKNMIRYTRSSHMLKKEYKKSPESYHDNITLAVNISMYVMPQVLESGCVVTPTKYNKHIRSKSLTIERIYTKSKIIKES